MEKGTSLLLLMQKKTSNKTIRNISIKVCFGTLFLLLRSEFWLSSANSVIGKRKEWDPHGCHS